MLSEKEIDLLVAEQRARLVTLNEAGKLDGSRGLREIEGLLLGESQDRNRKIMQAISEVEGKKKPVSNADQN
jgi:hypothetical protein